METAGFAAAEAVGAVVALGIIGVADTVAPGAVQATTNFIAKNYIEPHLETIEKGLGVMCKLEECKPDQNTSREERARRLARATVLFGAAWVPSLAAKVVTRRGINEICGMGDKAPWWNVFKANSHDTAIFWWDEGVHYGSMAILNSTYTGAKVSDEMLRSCTSILEKAGVPKDKAHDISAMAVIHEFPNLLGFVSGVAKIAHLQFRGASHVDKLAAQTALSNTLHPTHS